MSINILKHSNHKHKLNTHIHSLIKDNQLNMNLGIKIVSMKDGTCLFELNSEKLMTPASNIKLLTSAASLHYLGSGYVFQTVITKQGDNIMLTGGADPQLSIENLDSISMEMSKKINFIDTLYVNEGLLDSIYYGKGWMWDEGSEKYSAPVSALTLNDNCVDFSYSPNELGKPAKIELYPNTRYISISNNSTTVSDTINLKKIKIDRDWINQTNHYTISGEILEWNSKDTVKKNISNPSLFAGTIFKELLESHGTSVKTIQRINGMPFYDTIAVNYSSPLSMQLNDMMHNSNNLTSELLIKFMGKTDTTNGTWKNGIRNVKIFLFDEVNIDTSSLRITDGSGLSRYNLLSPNQIIQLLVYANKTNLIESFIQSLPHGNEKDTRMEGRMIGTDKKIYAKTGSISGVSCISGYADSPTYGPLAFSIMINGFVGPLTPYRKFQDEICEWLVKN